MKATAKSDAETFERLLSKRHSCRGFLHDPVADDLIVRILSISQRTPSWCNAQPWQAIITKGAATERFRAALCDYFAKNPPAPDITFPREYRGVYLERRRALRLPAPASRGGRSVPAVSCSSSAPPISSADNARRDLRRQKTSVQERSSQRLSRLGHDVPRAFRRRPAERSGAGQDAAPRRRADESGPRALAHRGARR